MSMNKTPGKKAQRREQRRAAPIEREAQLRQQIQHDLTACLRASRPRLGRAVRGLRVLDGT